MSSLGRVPASRAFSAAPRAGYGSGLGVVSFIAAGHQTPRSPSLRLLRVGLSILPGASSWRFRACFGVSPPPWSPAALPPSSWGAAAGVCERGLDPLVQAQRASGPQARASERGPGWDPGLPPRATSMIEPFAAKGKEYLSKTHKLITATGPMTYGKIDGPGLATKVNPGPGGAAAVAGRAYSAAPLLKPYTG